jgi:hypothetical protein
MRHAGIGGLAWASVLSSDVNRPSRRLHTQRPAHARCYNSDNKASRADPARGPRRCPQEHGNPRKTRCETPWSRWESPPIPAKSGSGKTGLSRRRSRVRVPSLPFSWIEGSRPSHGLASFGSRHGIVTLDQESSENVASSSNETRDPISGRRVERIRARQMLASAGNTVR